MLGKLKIRCIYSINGCQEILSLNNLDDHQKSCRFETCEDCFCIRSVDHNCVKSLLESKRKSDEIIIDLRCELKLAYDKISSMKSEMDNYLQTSQELSNNSRVAKTMASKQNNPFLKNRRTNDEHQNISNTSGTEYSVTVRGNRWREASSVNTAEKPPECKQQ